MSRAHRPPTNRSGPTPAEESPNWVPGKFDAASAAARIARATPYRGDTVFRKAEEGAEDKGEEPAAEEETEEKVDGDEGLQAEEKDGQEEMEAGGEGKDVEEKAPAIGAKLESRAVFLAVDPTNREYVNWLRKVKLGSPTSETNQQLFEHRASTVPAYVGLFKKGGMNSKLPDGAKTMTVEQALIAGEVEDVNVRKLLTDLREKFNK